MAKESADFTASHSALRAGEISYHRPTARSVRTTSLSAVVWEHNPRTSRCRGGGQHDLGAEETRLTLCRPRETSLWLEGSGSSSNVSSATHSLLLRCCCSEKRLGSRSCERNEVSLRNRAQRRLLTRPQAPWHRLRAARSVLPHHIAQRRAHILLLLLGRCVRRERESQSSRQLTNHVWNLPSRRRWSRTSRKRAGAGDGLLRRAGGCWRWCRAWWTTARVCCSVIGDSRPLRTIRRHDKSETPR